MVHKLSVIENINTDYKVSKVFNFNSPRMWQCSKLCNITWYITKKKKLSADSFFNFINFLIEQTSKGFSRYNILVQPLTFNIIKNQ